MSQLPLQSSGEFHLILTCFPCAETHPSTDDQSTGLRSAPNIQEQATASLFDLIPDEVLEHIFRLGCDNNPEGYWPDADGWDDEPPIPGPMAKGAILVCRRWEQIMRLKLNEQQMWHFAVSVLLDGSPRELSLFRERLMRSAKYDLYIRIITRSEGYPLARQLSVRFIYVVLRLLRARAERVAGIHFLCEDGEFILPLFEDLSSFPRLLSFIIEAPWEAQSLFSNEETNDLNALYTPQAYMKSPESTTHFRYSSITNLNVQVFSAQERLFAFMNQLPNLIYVNWECPETPFGQVVYLEDDLAHMIANHRFLRSLKIREAEMRRTHPLVYDKRLELPPHHLDSLSLCSSSHVLFALFLGNPYENLTKLTLVLLCDQTPLNEGEIHSIPLPSLTTLICGLYHNYKSDGPCGSPFITSIRPSNLDFLHIYGLYRPSDNALLDTPRAPAAKRTQISFVSCMYEMAKFTIDSESRSDMVWRCAGVVRSIQDLDLTGTENLTLRFPDGKFESEISCSASDFALTSLHLFGTQSISRLRIDRDKTICSLRDFLVLLRLMNLCSLTEASLSLREGYEFQSSVVLMFHKTTGNETEERYAGLLWSRFQGKETLLYPQIARYGLDVVLSPHPLEIGDILNEISSPCMLFRESDRSTEFLLLPRISSIAYRTAITDDDYGTNSRMNLVRQELQLAATLRLSLGAPFSRATIFYTSSGREEIVYQFTE